jgi:hypothetical protein
MTAAGTPSGRGWLALAALPVLCCVGHVLLVALGVGSLSAVVGGVTGSVVLAGLGLLLVAAAALVAVRRTKVRR